MADPRPATAQSEDNDESAPWREPVRGGFADESYFALSGLEQMRAMLAGAAPRPPIGRLTGMHIVEARDGVVAFRMPLSEWLLSPQGAISIGPLTIPADGAVACSILTMLPPATPFTTSELSLRLLAPVEPGGYVTARGRLIQLRKTIGLAEVAVIDEQDQLIAHGSTLCFVLPPVTPAADPPSRRFPAEASHADADPSPDPYERPVRGSVLEQAIWEELSGLEVLEAQLAGALPRSPIHYLTGLTLSAAALDDVTFTMPASPWLCAPLRTRVQGGAVATLGEAALSASIQTRMPPGTALAPIDLKVNYLRPLTADGRPAVARGRVQHAGRRIAVANAEVRDADGRLVALATGSAMVLQGRPASLQPSDG
jgi:uncharacterized protein (TIGR00369 family)